MIFSKNAKTRFSTLTDKELVISILKEQVRESQRQMQEELYERYAEKVFAKCVQMIRNRDVAQDLAHDIMVKVLLQLASFRGEAPLFSWIYAITYNHCLRYLEQKKKWRLEDFDSHSYEFASDEMALENKILKDLRLSQLELLMGKLEERERMLLLMKYQDGLSVKQIARTLSVGESAVKMRLKRSRDHLAELLKRLDHDGR